MRLLALLALAGCSTTGNVEWPKAIGTNPTCVAFCTARTASVETIVTGNPALTSYSDGALTSTTTDTLTSGRTP